MVTGKQELTEILPTLFSSPELSIHLSEAAGQCIKGQRGVIGKHLELIDQLL